jgi:hypothetical protein
MSFSGAAPVRGQPSSHEALDLKAVPPQVEQRSVVHIPMPPYPTSQTPQEPVRLAHEQGVYMSF